MATTKTVQLRDFADEVGAHTERQIKNLRVATLKAVVGAIPMLVEKSPVDTGLYASSWAFTETEHSIILGNFAPHAPIIEDGARPFTPPIAPLLAWAKRVLNDSSQPPNYSARVRQLAYFTQQKIAREGMKPHKILANAIPEILERIKREYEAVA